MISRRIVGSPKNCFFAWNNEYAFIISRMVRILKEGTEQSRKVHGSSGCGIALTISILLKTQHFFGTWSIQMVFFPCHVPICSLRHFKESGMTKIKYLTGSRHKTETSTCWLGKQTFLFSAWYAKLVRWQKKKSQFCELKSYISSKTLN